MSGVGPGSPDTGHTSFFLGANAVNSLLGAISVLLAARWLGAAEYGVLAVVLAVATLCASFVDLRIIDLAGKLYYDAPSPGALPGGSESAPERRAGILVLAWISATVTALSGAALAVLLGPWVVAMVTSLNPPPVLIVLAAAITATQALSGVVLQMLRFTGGARSIGAARVLGSVVNTVATGALVSRDPTAFSALSATLMGALTSLVMAHASALRTWTRREDLRMASPALGWAVRAGLDHLSLLWYGNLMGYLKMLQRSFDVILVARVGGETAAGVYKLARQAADQGLAILQEAYHTAEHPRALKLATAGGGEQFRALARSVLVQAGAWIGAGLALGVLLLPIALGTLLGNDYVDALPAILLLTINGVYLVGIHPWAWAWVLVRNRTGVYTGWQAGAVMVQYAVALILMAPIHGLFGGPEPPTCMAAGVLSGYTILTVLLLAAMRVETPGWIPGGRVTEGGDTC